MPCIFSERMLGPILSYKLTSGNKNNFSDILNISEGLENRILKYKHCTDIDELVSLVYCKRYITSRIRRALYSIIFNLEKSDVLPTYTKILAFSDTGRTFLNSVKKTSKIELYSKISRKDIFKNQVLNEEVRVNALINNILVDN